MPVRDVLLLGNPALYTVSTAVEKDDLPQIFDLIEDLHDTLADFRERYGVGRAIAAPQIGVMKRLIYMYIDSPVVFINPVLEEMSGAMIDVWDDCLSFPDLFVKVRRHKSCRIRYYHTDFAEKEMWLEDDMAELLQHECDHLDGVIAVSRAIDERSFALRSQKEFITGE